MPTHIAYFRTSPIWTYIHTTQCWVVLICGQVCLCPTHSKPPILLSHASAVSVGRTSLLRQLLTIFTAAFLCRHLSISIHWPSEFHRAPIVSQYSMLIGPEGLCSAILGFPSTIAPSAEPFLTTNFHFEPPSWPASKRL